MTRARCRTSWQALRAGGRFGPIRSAEDTKKLIEKVRDRSEVPAVKQASDGTEKITEQVARSRLPVDVEDNLVQID